MPKSIFQATMLLIIWAYFLVWPPLDVVAAGRLIHEDDFSSFEQWYEEANFQHWSAEKKCGSEYGEFYHWENIDQQAQLNITTSLPCTTVLLPKTDLSLSSDLATHIEFDWTIGNRQEDRNWLISWVDKDNYLGWHIFDQHLYLEKYVAGESYTWEGIKIYYRFSHYTTYRVELDYYPRQRLFTVKLDGQEVARVYEPVEDPQLTSGQAGLMGSVGVGSPRSKTSIDNWQWWLSDEQMRKMNVINWKQSDVLWGNDEYDSASSWVQNDKTSITRWGCALTTAAMVANYHGLKYLPNSNTPLNPGTLNQWLIEQADGYWPEGMLNWRAISRLTSLQTTPSSTQLEFSFEFPHEPLKWLAQQLDRQIPVILAEPNHFVVATGYQPDLESTALSNWDWYINDPFYDYPTLMPYDNSFESARFFRPSHTDLSAITVVLPSSWSMTSNGSEAPFYWETSPLGKRWKVYDTVKPNQSSYHWEIKSAGLTPQEVGVYVYSKSGDLSLNKQILTPRLDPYQVTVQPNNLQVTEWENLEIHTDPISTVQWSQWLKDNSLKSPLIVDQYQNDWQTLISCSNLECGEEILTIWQQKISVWHQNGWINDSLSEYLDIHLENQIKLLFP